MITETLNQEQCNNELDKKPKKRKIITTKYDYIDELCQKYPHLTKKQLLSVISKFQEHIARELRNGYYYRVTSKRFSFYICPNIENGVEAMLQAQKDLKAHRARKKIIAWNYENYIKKIKHKKKNERTNK